jgi:aspartyl-tRNA(Asn)/glutamyl-tRNA(Gln) amidotransferase subunit A
VNDAPHRRSLAEIAAAVCRGAPDATATAGAAMAEIVRGESGPRRLNAFISFRYEDALAEAAAVDARIAAGERPALAGVPIAIKDNICTLGLPTTCGSRMLARYVSPYEATVVRRLRAAGAVAVGKTNLDEFGMGSSTEHSAFGTTRHPLDPGRVPGGSSGGSAAAVAAGWVPAALGSDTGGSVRQPASFCGIVGIKPSYGRVSRYGLVAYASSLDQVGVLAGTVEDAALLLQTIAGSDPLDATTATLVVPDYAAAARTARERQSLAGLVVGVPAEYFEDVDAGVREACDNALDVLRALGADVRHVSLPHTHLAVPTYYIIAPAEASANLARYDGVRYGSRAAAGTSTSASASAQEADLYAATRSAGFGAEVRRRIMLGTWALSAGYHDEYYGTAQRVRSLISGDFDRVFADGIDLLFTPTTPTTAFRIGEKTADPYEMYRSDIFTVTANLAALPALSLPVGSSDGMPVGGQLIGGRWREDVMIAAAAALEGALAR